MRLFRTTIPNDCIAVIDAAGRLGIREIDFFRLAYRRWFGREIRPLPLERIFAAYMFAKAVPAWVRHLSRVVLTEDAAGRLDRAVIGADRYRRYSPPHRHGRLFVGLTLLVVVLYCAALLEISYDPETSAPLHCQGGPGFRILSEIAHGFSGKDLPACKAPEAPIQPPARR